MLSPEQVVSGMNRIVIVAFASIPREFFGPRLVPMTSKCLFESVIDFNVSRIHLPVILIVRVWDVSQQLTFPKLSVAGLYAGWITLVLPISTINCTVVSPENVWSQSPPVVPNV